MTNSGGFAFTLRQVSLLLFLIVNLISAAYIPPRRLTRPQLDQTHNAHPVIKRNPLPLPQDPDLLEVIPTATALHHTQFPTALQLPSIRHTELPADAFITWAPPPEAIPTTAPYEQFTTIPYQAPPAEFTWPPPEAFITTAPYTGYFAKRKPSPLPQNPEDLLHVVPTPPPSPPPLPTPEPVVTPLPEPVTPLPPAITPLPPAVTPILEPVTPLPPAVSPIADLGAEGGGIWETPVVVPTPVAAKRAGAPRAVRRKRAGRTLQLI